MSKPNSFIPKQDRTPKTRLTVQIRQDVAQRATAYAAYLESSLDHVTEQLFLKAFRSDKGFEKLPASTSTEPQIAPQVEAKSEAHVAVKVQPRTQPEPIHVGANVQPVNSLSNGSKGSFND